MPEPEHTVFVNERLVRLEAGTTVLDAIRASAPELVDVIGTGRGYVTDGRGIRIPPEQTIEPGAIIRVVVSARRPPADADA